jgi:hypothetical protein
LECSFYLEIDKKKVVTSLKIYVIMPRVSDPKSKIKLQILQKVAENYNYHLNVPEYSLEKSIFDLNMMINQIKKSAIVIVDLSLERPSCYYELGVAETLHKTIFLFAELGTVIHQTSYRNKVFFYGDLTEFERQIEMILKGLTSVLL